jgi:BON domain-containing protein
MANRDYDPNDDRELRNEHDWRRGNPNDPSRNDPNRNDANRGYRGGHMSGGAMGNRGALGSNFLGPTNFGGGELIGGGNNAGYGAGGMWPNFDASMDGYSGTMGDETDLGGYGNARPRGGYGGYDTGRPNFAGRGSKNYKRSDTRIEEDVHEALMHDPYLDATDVDVSVKDGEVTLSGEVADRAARRHAEECVERCAGVREIHNNLKARRGLMGRTADERDVTSRAERDDR